MNDDNSLYFFNDQYDAGIIDHAMKTMQYQLYSTSLKLQSDFQSFRSIFGTMSQFTINETLNKNCKLPIGTYTYECNTNIVPYYSKRVFINKYNFKNPITLIDILMDTETFSKKLIFYVGGYTFPLLRVVVLDSSVILAIYNSDTDGIGLNKLNSFITNNVNWSLTSEPQSDCMQTIYASYTSFFNSGTTEIPISKFTKITSFNKDDLVNAWNIMVTGDRTSKNLYVTSTAELTDKGNGNIVVTLSQAFYDYMKINVELSKFYLINCYHKDGGLIYTDLAGASSSPIFQIPFINNPVASNNILAWEYNPANKTKKGLVPTSVNMLYPNIYDFRNSKFTDNIDITAPQGKNLFQPAVGSVTTGSATATNLVVHGNFDSGVSGWAISGPYSIDSSIKYTGNQSLKFTMNNSTSAVVATQNILGNPGDKIYCRAMVNLQSNPSATQYAAYLTIANTNQSVELLHCSCNTAILNSWQLLSGIATVASGDTGIAYRFYSYHAICSGNLGACMAINLTKLFGVGNEWTKAQMDTLITNYFDGSSTVGGLTCTVDADQHILLDGIVASTAIFYINSNGVFKNIPTNHKQGTLITGKPYSFSRTSISGSSGLVAIYMFSSAGILNDGSTTWQTANTIFNFNKNTDYDGTYFWIGSKNIFSSYKFAIQLEQSAVVTSWEQFYPPQLYLEWYNSELTKSEFDDNVKQYMSYKGDSYISEMVNHTISSVISGYAPLANYMYDLPDFLASSDYPNIRQYKKNKLISLLEDNPERYKQLLRSINTKNKKSIYNEFNKTKNPSVFSRAVSDNHNQITDISKLVTFTEPCTFIKYENNTTALHPYYLFIDGKRKLPALTCTEGGFDYVYIKKSQLSDTSIIIIDAFLIDFNATKPYGEVNLGNTYYRSTFPNYADFKYINPNDLVYYDTSTKEYINKSSINDYLNVLSAIIKDDSKEYEIQYLSSEVTYMLTSLQEFFNTKNTEQITLASKKDCIIGPSLFNKKINSMDVSVSPVSTDNINRMISITTTTGCITGYIPDLRDTQTITLSNFTEDPSPDRFNVYIDGKLAKNGDGYVYTAPKKFGDNASFTILKYNHADSAVEAIVDYIPLKDEIIFNDIPSTSVYDTKGIIHLENSSTHPFIKDYVKVSINSLRVPLSSIHDIGGNDMITIDDYDGTSTLKITAQSRDADCYNYAFLKSKSMNNLLAKEDLNFEAYLAANPEN